METYNSDWRCEPATLWKGGAKENVRQQTAHIQRMQGIKTPVNNNILGRAAETYHKIVPKLPIHDTGIKLPFEPTITIWEVIA